uniref:Uncharacterized protein n=1 Tax=Globodera rostochiensis TaxID=31243 RepID=A0A914HMM5_GLORO
MLCWSADHSPLFTFIANRFAALGHKFGQKDVPRRGRIGNASYLVLIDTDMLCWLPTLFFGFSGLTADHAEQCDVGSGVVYPINSCANPLLYMFQARFNASRRPCCAYRCQCAGRLTACFFEMINYACRFLGRVEAAFFFLIQFFGRPMRGMKSQPPLARAQQLFLHQVEGVHVVGVEETSQCVAHFVGRDSRPVHDVQANRIVDSLLKRTTPFSC